MRGGPGGEGSPIAPDARAGGFFLALFGVFLGFFFGVSFGVVFSSFLGVSKRVLEPNMAPSWVDFGAMLGTFWTFLGVVLASSLKILLETIFDRFSIDFRPPGS